MNIKNLLKINNISIKSKFIISFTLFISFIAIFIYLYFPALYKEQATNFAVEKALSIAEITSFSISPALFFEDKQSLNDALLGTLQNKDIEYLIICDAKNQIVFQSNLKLANNINYKQDNYQKPREINGHLIYKISKSVIYKNKLIGKL
jgi:hypothetical protein